MTAGELRDLLTPARRSARLRLVLAGKPVSGKSTYGPLILKRYGLVHISTGDLVRAQVRAGTPLGRAVEQAVAGGQLLPDELILTMLENRIKQSDCVACGYVLDGFPRTKAQTDAMVQKGIAVDAVIVLQRSDEDVMRWALHRLTDPLTGAIYHPEFNPPPQDDPELLARLEKRTDDEEHIVKRRLETFRKMFPETYGCWKDSTYEIDTGVNRQFVDVFKDLCAVIDPLVRAREAEERATAESHAEVGAYAELPNRYNTARQELRAGEKKK